MRSPGYCIYNATNECFLSLGTRLGCDWLAPFKRWFRRDIGSLDEGYWLAPIARAKTLGILSRHNVIHLDDHHKVVDIHESFVMQRLVPRRAGARSLLILPEHTIRASNTQAGNQLVICSPEDMEAWLRKGLELKDEPGQKAPEITSIDSLNHRRPVNQAPDKRLKERRKIPSLCAHYLHSGAMAWNRIRDISGSGLYLVTEERWPVGMRVTMTLEPLDTQNAETAIPILVHLKVTRWGTDGLGLEFIFPRNDVDTNVRLFC